MSAQAYSPGTNAALVRLRFAKPLEVNDALKELLDRNEGLEEGAEIVLSKLKAGEHFASDYLVQLVAATHNAALFAQAREQLLQNDAAVLGLYEGRYPDSEIETKLCEILWHIRSEDSNWLRRGIVQAMQAVGSADVLPVLGAIRFDMGPKARVGQIAKVLFPEESNGMLENLELSSRTQFLQAVNSAIDAVKRR